MTKSQLEELKNIIEGVLTNAYPVDMLIEALDILNEYIEEDSSTPELACPVADEDHGEV